MSWVITPSFYGYITDADAKDYLSRVHAAEGQTLEPAVALAVEAFIIGCKADGIWPAIKASCILAGARTLAGALVPLVGSTPTSFNFVSGNYNRKTGLLGDGSTTYLRSNRLNNADPQNSCHLAVYCTALPSINSVFYIGSGTSQTGTNSIVFSVNGNGFMRNRNGTSVATTGMSTSTGFIGSTRNASTQWVGRWAESNTTYTQDSQVPNVNFLDLYALNGANYSNARLAFYSIGESLDLALLDARVTTLVNAFAAAIP
jgi:hypothetical protein